MSGVAVDLAALAGGALSKFAGPSTPPLFRVECAELVRRAARPVEKDAPGRPLCCRSRQRLLHGGPEAKKAAAEEAATLMFSWVDTLTTEASTSNTLATETEASSGTLDDAGPESDTTANSTTSGGGDSLSIVEPTSGESSLPRTPPSEGHPTMPHEHPFRLRQWSFVKLANGETVAVSRVVERWMPVASAELPEDLPRAHLVHASPADVPASSD